MVLDRPVVLYCCMRSDPAATAHPTSQVWQLQVITKEGKEFPAERCSQNIKRKAASFEVLAACASALLHFFLLLLL